MINSTTVLNDLYKKGKWSVQNAIMSGLYNDDINVITHIKLRIMEWAVHICMMDGSGTPKRS
jgi:hypothetical protein